MSTRRIRLLLACRAPVPERHVDLRSDPGHRLRALQGMRHSVRGTPCERRYRTESARPSGARRVGAAFLALSGGCSSDASGVKPLCEGANETTLTADGESDPDAWSPLKDIYVAKFRAACAGDWEM